MRPPAGIGVTLWPITHRDLSCSTACGAIACMSLLCETLSYGEILYHEGPTRVKRLENTRTPGSEAAHARALTAGCARARQRGQDPERCRGGRRRNGFQGHRVPLL